MSKDEGLLDLLGSIFDIREDDPKERKEFKRWFMENGRLFKKIGDPKSIIENFSIKPRKKECQHNSLLAILVNRDRDLKFYTGYATTKLFQGIFYPHSFNVLNDEVIDTTWDHGLEYFGVEIPYEFACIKLLESWNLSLAEIYFSERIKQEDE